MQDSFADQFMASLILEVFLPFQKLFTDLNSSTQLKILFALMICVFWFVCMLVKMIQGVITYVYCYLCSFIWESPTSQISDRV